MRVGEVMSTDVITIGPDAPLKAAASTMVKSGVSGLPVVDERMHLLGIITEADFVTAEANRSWGRQRRRLLATYLGDFEEMSARTVGDSMTANPHSIDKDSTVTDAARKMTELNVKRLPVVTAEGLLEGIVSRADVMRAFARSDEALRDEVIASFEPVLLADGDDVMVEVQNGVVEITGTVAFRTGAQLLEELASRVEGVMAVSSKVAFETDDVDG